MTFDFLVFNLGDAHSRISVKARRPANYIYRSYSMFMSVEIKNTEYNSSLTVYIYYHTLARVGGKLSIESTDDKRRHWGYNLAGWQNNSSPTNIVCHNRHHHSILEQLGSRIYRQQQWQHLYLNPMIDGNPFDVRASLRKNVCMGAMDANRKSFQIQNYYPHLKGNNNNNRIQCKSKYDNN